MSAKLAHFAGAIFCSEQHQGQYDGRQFGPTIMRNTLAIRDIIEETLQFLNAGLTQRKKFVLHLFQCASDKFKL
jgi:hypothetical protein